MNIKRIAALIGVIILFSMYGATLVLALLGNANTLNLFVVSLLCTIMVPVIIHLFMMLLNARKGKNVMDETYSYREKTSSGTANDQDKKGDTGDQSPA